MSDMNLTLEDQESQTHVLWWQPVVFAAMAGGMAWGIRGQYGHETGAMIAGLLVSLTLVILFCPKFSLINAVRAVAWCTVGMGLGGSMTYGQTVGLTHDAPLIGHWGALGWGMLGLSIKGAIWIGFAGAFLGMGLGGKRYRYLELLILMLCVIGAFFLGSYLLNSPFDPENKMLPKIYFSDHWHWEPGSELKPRPECWGGLLFALVLIILYTALWRKDSLAPRMALWGILGGAIGFPLGQSLQAFHAWNSEIFDQGFWTNLDPHINWWNMMETTYGATMGALLGLGLWLNQNRIQQAADSEKNYMPLPAEWILLAVHLVMLVLVEFMAIGWVDMFYDLGLIMGIIPIMAIAGGRWWPYLVIFPVTLMPIAGKTVRQLVYNEGAIQPVLGWIIYLIVPLLLAIGMAVLYKRLSAKIKLARPFMRYALLFNAWMYFLLNFAFFRFPWPWAEWTGRTPNGIIFTICVLGLTVMVLMSGKKQVEHSD